MLLDINYNTYLSVIQDDCLGSLYKILPSLKPSDDCVSWVGWKELKIKPNRTMGLFVSIENYDSPILVNDLGPLDSPEVTNLENSSKAWLMVEIVALCEALRTNVDQELVFPFTFALSERLKIVEVIEDVSKTKFLRSESQRDVAGKKWIYLRQIKDVARELFQKFSHEKPISHSELTNLLQNNGELEIVCPKLGYDFCFVGGEGELMIFSFGDGVQQRVSVKTIPNWRSEFNKVRNK